VKRDGSTGSGRGRYLLLQTFGVEADLDLDRRQVRLLLRESGEHLLPVRQQQLKALLLVTVTGTYERGIAAHLPDRHPGGAQPGDHLDPSEIALLVPAVPADRTWWSAQQQVVTFVV